MSSLNINDESKLKHAKSEEVLEEKSTSRQVAAPGSYPAAKSGKSKQNLANNDGRADVKSEKGEFAKFCAQRSLPTKNIQFLFPHE